MRSAPIWNHVAFLAPLAVMSSIAWRCQLSIAYRFPPDHGSRDLGAMLVFGVLANVGPAAALAGTILARRARRP
jgi:hypothetical protein